MFHHTTYPTPMTTFNVTERFIHACNKEKGYVCVVIGPMFSGKTSTLIQVYNQIQQSVSFDKSVKCFNYSEDTRYGENTNIISHDKTSIKAIPIKEARSMLDHVEDADIFLINEGQFMTGLYDVTKQLLEHKKKVLIVGLDFDYRKQWFEEMEKIVIDMEDYCSYKENKKIFDTHTHTETHINTSTSTSHESIESTESSGSSSDNTYKGVVSYPAILRRVAFCDMCRSSIAHYTCRTIKSDSRILIGSNEAYKPVCIQCYHRNETAQNK